MARSEFEVKEQWIGTGDLAAYTFNYKIEHLLHLLIYVQDASGTLVPGYPIRGDDVVNLASVSFDAVAGGGTITLASVLPTDYVLTALLANDAPTQPSEYQTKTSFTLPSFEAALDFLAGAIQRVSYLAQRTMRLSDMDDEDAISLVLPQGFADNPGASLAVNVTGDGIEYGLVLGDVTAVVTAAAAAAALSETNAAASAAAAVVTAAAAAAASAASVAAAAADAVAAAASAAAAAVSAASAASATGMTMYGTYAAPLSITAAGGLANNITGEQASFIKGSPGAVTVSANPQIAAGTVIGQKLGLIGVDDTNTVTLANGTGLRMNGNITLGDGDLIWFFWDGNAWQESYRNS